jgi:hypothetical protein
MRRLIQFCRTAMAVLCLALVLAACTITSKTALVGEDEGATPLPDAFTFFPYEYGTDGFVRSTDGPATFRRDGNQYIAANVPDMNGTINIRLLPLGSGYLLAATAADTPGMIYGFASYVDGVLSIYLSPNEKTAAALQQERKGSMPKTRAALTGLAIDPQTDAITITNRRALDYLGDMYAIGRLPMDRPTVAYIDEDPTATLPARLVQSGVGWIKVP